jgi:hypothetical protein
MPRSSPRTRVWGVSRTSFSLFAAAHWLAIAFASETLQQAEAIAKTNLSGRDPREFGVASLVVRERPSVKPGIHQAGSIGEDLIGHHVGKQRELKAPALHVLVARGASANSCNRCSRVAAPSSSSRMVTREPPGGIGWPLACPQVNMMRFGGAISSTSPTTSTAFG